MNVYKKTDRFIFIKNKLVVTSEEEGKIGVGD